MPLIICPAPAMPEVAQLPSHRLLCTNLPQEVTDDVLSVLFQQWVFHSLHLGIELKIPSL